MEGKRVYKKSIWWEVKLLALAVEFHVNSEPSGS